MKTINPTNSSFEILINGGHVYVDKTKYLYDLIRIDGLYCFCSRPRRFGKSLAVSTFKAIFEGRKELFEGLRISQTNYDWKVYPVFHFDFSAGEVSSAKEFSNWLNGKISDYAKQFGLRLSTRAGVKTNFERLIRKASEKGRCVILVDEYDKPLSDNVFSDEVEGIRNAIRGFFEVVKAMAEFMRFVFITGVTRYAKVSIFSSMNNLVDISSDESYSSMFGYTQEELEKNFADMIEEGVSKSALGKGDYMAKLKDKYDGYCFSPGCDTVYNPVSIGLFFFKGGKRFENFWYDIGGRSKLVIEVAKKVGFDISREMSK